jgi:hypothetical protein
VPSKHLSLPLQRLPSAHGVPLLRTVDWQRPPMQRSTEQGLASLHSALLSQLTQPGITQYLQTPCEQVLRVQGFRSSQSRALEQHCWWREPRDQTSRPLSLCGSRGVLE